MTSSAMRARKTQPKKKAGGMQAVGSEGDRQNGWDGQNGGIPPLLTISMASLWAHPSIVATSSVGDVQKKGSGEKPLRSMDSFRFLIFPF